MVSKLISTAGLLAMVIGILMGFGTEGMRWHWLAGGLSISALLFWCAGRLGRKDE